MIWAVKGNCFAGWREYFPLANQQGREHFKHMLRYYTFQTHDVPETVGHNPLAATVYFAVFLMYWAMILSGFAMYAEYAPGGIMHTTLRPVYMLFTTQQLHFWHHMLMWVIFGFVINHIYSAWLMDIKERGSEVSSMFSGFKFTVEKKVT
jgi:Ni/Fe-hydrogenase 1 B-type cytochrome subunit